MQTLCIRRYGNRKFYCSWGWLSLREIRQFIRDGIPFAVFCHKTKLNITDLIYKRIAELETQNYFVQK